MNEYKKQGLQRIINAFGYSFAGLKTAFIKEAAFRQVLLISVILLIITIFLDVSKIEKLLLISTCFISLIVELFNSAIEACIDRISLEKHELSKQAKDLGSAAQMISMTFQFIVWFVILFM